MLGVKITAAASHSQEILVRTDVPLYEIPLLTSNGSGYYCDFHEKLYMIIRK